MNNNLITERSMRGLFSTSSYITVNDKYGEKQPPDPRHVSAQFKMERPHYGMAGGRTNNVLFEREHKWLYGYKEGEKYIDKTEYRKSQPNRVRAFNSSDAFRSDEFTNHFPSEQWRERMRKETNYNKKIADQNAAKLVKTGLPEIERKVQQIEPSWTHGPKFLYDVGREEEDGSTPWNMKDGKDTWYSRFRSPYASNNPEMQTRYGSLSASSQTYGYGNDRVNFARPAFARQPIVRDSFFRNHGILATGRGPPI